MNIIMMSAAASQALVRPFCSVRSSAQPSRRPCRLVVRAQQVDSKAGLAAVLRKVEVLKPAAVAVVANVLMALPAHAEGKLFDFGLTLPVMVGEFLLLMVFLDKTWFTPVGKHLDERDQMIRTKLSSFRDNNSAVNEMQAEAEKIIAEARNDAAKAVKAAKAEASAVAAEQIAAMKSKVDKELATAMAALDKEKEDAMADMDEQVEALSADILLRILPEGVKLSA